MNKTASILKKLIRESKLISDFDVTVKGETHHFNNLHVSKFGVINAVCLNKKGELYGTENDEFFALVDKKLERELIPNLIRVADKNEKALREIFAKEKVYNIKIESVIVLENSGCKPLITAPKVPILNLSELKKHLKQDKFANDNKANIEQILNAIDRYKAN